MPGRGLDVIPLRIPDRWDPGWFETFVRDVLSLADVRNATEGAGITITGQSDDTATLASSEDVLELLTVGVLTAEASDLANARQLVAGNGITLTDAGAGETLEISATPQLWYDIDGVPIYVAAAESAAWDFRIAGAVVGYVGIAGATNGIATGSVSGDLVLAPTAGRVFIPGTAPRVSLYESDASADRKLVDLLYDGAVLSMRTRTDADGAGLTFFRMSRGATTAVSNVHVGVPSTWGLFAQPTSSSITGTNHGTTFSAGGLSQSATAVGSQVGLSFSNVDGTDGARSFISLAVDGGAQGVTWMTMPAANTASYLTNGPASGAYTILTLADGPLSLGLASTEYARFSSSFNHWRVPNYFAPGDASAPGISFLTTVAGAAPAADSNTGIYWIGADNVGFTAGGTLRFDYNATRALFAIRVDTPASASGGAGLRAPHGAAPSAPVDGDIWTTTAGLFVRINGATVGPLT